MVSPKMKVKPETTKVVSPKMKVETAEVVSPKVILQPFLLFLLPELCVRIQNIE